MAICLRKASSLAISLKLEAVHHLFVTKIQGTYRFFTTIYIIVNSCKIFTGDYKVNFDIKWDKYYQKFISISSKIKYITVDYDKLINDPQSTYDEFYNKIIPFIPNLSKINVSNIVKHKHNKLINSNYIHYIVKNNKILDFDSKKCYKYKCFCDSMKKYNLSL